MRKNDKINNALGITNDIKQEMNNQLNILNADDIEIAKENIKDLIYKGTSSLDDIIDIAKQSQQPRAFEVVASLLKVLVEANKDLVEVKATAISSNDNRQIHNNNFFVGNTSELLQMMKKEQKGEIIDGDW